MFFISAKSTCLYTFVNITNFKVWYNKNRTIILLDTAKKLLELNHSFNGQKIFLSRITVATNWDSTKVHVCSKLQFFEVSWQMLEVLP